MDYERMTKEKGSPWVAMQYGCCVSKADVVDEGREALRANGTFDYPHVSVTFTFASASLHAFLPSQSFVQLRDFCSTLLARRSPSNLFC